MHFAKGNGEVSPYCNLMKFPEAKRLCIKLDGKMLEYNTSNDIMRMLKTKLHNFHGCYQFWICPQGTMLFHKCMF